MLLEDGLGLRFLTHDHTHVPEAAGQAVLPCGDYSYRPPISFRWSYYRENAERPEFAVRMRVNTVELGDDLGGKTPQNCQPCSYRSHTGEERTSAVDAQSNLHLGYCTPRADVTRRGCLLCLSLREGRREEWTHDSAAGPTD